MWYKEKSQLQVGDQPLCITPSAGCQEKKEVWNLSCVSWVKSDKDNLFF